MRHWLKHLLVNDPSYHPLLCQAHLGFQDLAPGLWKWPFLLASINASEVCGEVCQISTQILYHNFILAVQTLAIGYSLGSNQNVISANWDGEREPHLEKIPFPSLFCDFVLMYRMYSSLSNITKLDKLLKQHVQSAYMSFMDEACHLFPPKCICWITDIWYEAICYVLCLDVLWKPHEVICGALQRQLYLQLCDVGIKVLMFRLKVCDY